MFDVSEAVCEGGKNGRNDGFCGDLELGILSIAVDVKSAEGEHIEDEQEGTKY